MSLGAVLLGAGVAAAEPAQGAAATPADTSASKVPAPPGAAPAPNSEALEEARRHFDVALECYSQGRYRDAIAELEAARRLDPAGKDLVYNLALVHEKLGELEQALDYLRRFLEMETDPEERARAEATITRLEGALGEGYAVAPEAPPSAPLAPVPAPLPAPGRLDAWVWGSGAVAISALIVGAVLGVRALAQRPGPDEGTGGSRSVDDVRSDAQQAHRSAVAADVAFGVAAVSGAAATLLYFGRSPLPAPAEPKRFEGGAEEARAAATHLPLESTAPKLGLDLNFAF